MDAPATAAVLTKSVIRAAHILGLPDPKLASIIGVSPHHVAELKNNRLLQKNEPEWGFGVLLVRMYQALDTIAGEDARRWLDSENGAFSGRKPIDVIDTPDGLIAVTNYLESHASHQ